MLNRSLKNLYYRVHISKYYSSLQSLNELYSESNKDEYLCKMEAFFSELVRFPQDYKNAPVESIYSNHAALLLNTEQLIKSRNADELNNLSNKLGVFLDELYDAISFITPRRKKYIIPVILVTCLAILAIRFYSPLKEKYYREKDQYNLLANEELNKQKTLDDILALKEALQKYYSDNKSFPKSSGGWDAINASFGVSKEDWIPGLAPRYIKELPVDPRKSKDPRQQYMYKSDGTDYKLIAHNPLGISEVIKSHPELVDPSRPSWAFGVWSEGAKNW